MSDIFLEVRERFPEWFKTEIEFLRESSKLLFKKRAPSLYGDEESLLSPNEIMSKEDAKDAIVRREKSYKLCKKPILELKKTVER